MVDFVYFSSDGILILTDVMAKMEQHDYDNQFAIQYNSDFLGAECAEIECCDFATMFVVFFKITQDVADFLS